MPATERAQRLGSRDPVIIQDITDRLDPAGRLRHRREEAVSFLLIVGDAYASDN
ncbi:MAG: hypothetical protein R2710_28340 [Acidimicrobiales bacterium]